MLAGFRVSIDVPNLYIGFIDCPPILNLLPISILFKLHSKFVVTALHLLLRSIGYP